MKQNSLFFVLGIALVVGIVGAKYLLRGPSFARRERAERAFGESVAIRDRLTMDRVDGTVHVPEFKGRPLMINFWASWCGPCMTEMPSIYELRKKYKDRGFEVLAINLDVDATQGARVLVERFGKPEFQIVRGHGENYPDIFEIEGVPYTVLVDRKGKIRYAKTGERNWIDQESIALVEGIL